MRNLFSQLAARIRRLGDRFRSVRTRRPYVWVGIVTTFLLMLATLSAHLMLIQPPAGFPDRTAIAVNTGSSLSEVAHHLQHQNVVRSGVAFQLLVQMRNDGDVQAGTYYFREPQSLWTVASALTTGAYGREPVQVTIPEGYNVWEIASRMASTVPAFDRDAFLNAARPHEGYLFPDTYNVAPDPRPQALVARMRENFNTRIDTLRPGIASSTRSLQDVVTMASILERETQTRRDKRMVAGILWKRLEIGMPLQVDAAFSYVNGKSTFDLTLQDLRDPSAYNTYRYKGLPPGPIANPGLEAIRAALHPIETEYLYYLSDLQSTIHYSETLEQHQRKKARYLD